MNRTADNTIQLSCPSAVVSIDLTKNSADLHAVSIVKIFVHALTCPLVILLNILVMLAVKTKRKLHTKSNIALACLATTDLMVGLFVQTLQITRQIFLLRGATDAFCSSQKIAVNIIVACVLASLYHLILLSAERYVAIKHPFMYDNLVTEVRIIVASSLAWAAAIILPTTRHFFLTNKLFLTILAAILLCLLFPAMVYFNIVVYKETRRNEKQIAANQVSLEAKEKILKNKKAFYTTNIVLVVFFLCYLPQGIFLVIAFYFKDLIPSHVVHIVSRLVSLLPVLNSLFNPLIYAVRIRYFRVAFIHFLSRKTIAQAEELERKLFGPRQIRAMANVEQGQNRASRENVQQENETLSNRNDDTNRAQPPEEYDQRPV